MKMSDDIKEHIEMWIWEVYYSWLDKEDANHKIELAKKEFETELAKFNINNNRPIEIKTHGKEILKRLYAIYKGRKTYEEMKFKFSEYEKESLRDLRAKDEIVKYEKKGIKPKRIIIDYGSSTVVINKNRELDLLHKIALRYSEIDLSAKYNQKLLAESKKKNRKTYSKKILSNMIEEFYSFLMTLTKKPEKKSIYNFIQVIFFNIGYLTKKHTGKMIEHLVTDIDPDAFINSYSNGHSTIDENTKEREILIPEINNLENFISGYLNETKN